MNQDRILSRLAVNSSLLLGVNVVSAGLNFVTSIMIARGLKEIRFGQYTFVMACVLSLSLFAEFGLNTLIAREVAQSRSEAGRYLIATSFAKLAFSLPLMIGLWILAPILSSSPEVVVALRLASPLVLLTSLYGSFPAIFRAYERMEPILLVSVTGLGIQCIVTAIIIASGRGLVELTLLAIVIQILQLCMGGLIYLRRYHSPTQIDLSFIKHTVRQTVPFGIAGVIGALELRLGIFMLAYISGDEALSQLAVATRITEVFRLLPNAFIGALLPALAVLADRQRGSASSLEKTFLSAYVGMFLFGALSGACLIIFAEPMITLTYGSNFMLAESSLRWMSLVLPASLLGTLLEIYLYAQHEENFVNWVTAGGVGVQVVIGILLIPLWGAAGAVAAMCIKELVMIGPLYWKRKQLLIQMSEGEME